jgi:hypothetical protein
MNGPGTEDRLAIYELYARYSWALDTGDTDGYVAMFTDDGEATEETRDGAIEVRRGRDEIRKLVLKFHDRRDFPGHQHQMAQLVSRPICTGADIFAISSRRLTVAGSSARRKSWAGAAQFSTASHADRIGPPAQSPSVARHSSMNATILALS